MISCETSENVSNAGGRGNESAGLGCYGDPLKLGQRSRMPSPERQAFPVKPSYNIPLLPKGIQEKDVHITFDICQTDSGLLNPKNDIQWTTESQAFSVIPEMFGHLFLIWISNPRQLGSLICFIFDL